MLIVEFLLLFLALPLALRLSPTPIPPLPILWAAALYCAFILRRTQTTALWNAKAIPPNLPAVLITFAAIATLILLATRLFAPELLFVFPRQRPALWAAVMVLYPILSVYPQALIYRAFFLTRYAPLVQGLPPAQAQLALILASAAAFAFMHIIFRNPIAPTLTFFGGLLFAWRYQQTQSLALTTLEHSLYGCLLFTAGLGQYFYHGRMRLQ